MFDLKQDYDNFEFPFHYHRLFRVFGYSKVNSCNIHINTISEVITFLIFNCETLTNLCAILFNTLAVNEFGYCLLLVLWLSEKAHKKLLTIVNIDGKKRYFVNKEIF